MVKGVMNGSVEDDEDLKRPKALLMDLPDVLAEWADQNHELVTRVQGALNNSYSSLSEDQIWAVVAASCSPEWRQARQDLRAVEADGAREHLALSHYTMINEGLRQRPDLGNLLSVLLVQKRMLNQSADHTLLTQKSTNSMTDMTSLRESFRHVARKICAAKKQIMLTNVTVPWSPET
jgi:hypothetical protein